MDWNDLRYFLSVARSGSTLAGVCLVTRGLAGLRLRTRARRRPVALHQIGLVRGELLDEHAAKPIEMAAVPGFVPRGERYCRPTCCAVSNAMVAS